MKPIQVQTAQLKKGDIVKLKSGVKPMTLGHPIEYYNRKAEITSVMCEVEGSLYLKEGLGGCRYWNVDDVELVERPEPKVKS